MKNKLLRFLFILFLTFSFGTVVKADDYGKIDQIDWNFSFNYIGQNEVLMRKTTAYTDLKCSGSTAHVEVIFHAYDPSDMEGDGWYEMRYKSSVTEDTTETMTCDWKGNYSRYAKEGHMTVTFDLAPSESEFSSVITLSGRLQDGVRDSNSDLKSLFGMDEIISSSVTSGGEFIKWDCPAGQSGHCDVYGNTTSDEQREAKAVVKFRKEGEAHEGYEYTVNLTILVKYKGAARAYPGDFTCNGFNNGQWKSATHDGELDYARATYYYSLANDNLTFPGDCQINKTIEIDRKFVGWSTSGDESGGMYNVEIQTTGTCADTIAVKPGGTVNLRDQANAGANNYFACGDYVPFVALVVGTGSISDSNWKKLSVGYVRYLESDTASATLPEVQYEAESFGATHEFGGWECQNRQRGYFTAKANDSVPAGTTCTAVDNSTAEYTDVTKRVYVGSTLVIAFSDKKVKSCTASSNDNLTTEVKDYKCIVTGVKSSDGDLVDVTVLAEENNFSRVYKVNVLDSAHGDVSFIVDVPVHGVTTTGESGGDFMTGTSCSTYTVGEKHDSNLHTAEGAETSVYQVKSDCTGSIFASVCLDPARTGASGDKYQKVEEIKPGSPLGKVLTATIQLMNNYPNSEEILRAFKDVSVTSGTGAELRAAAQIAARIVGIATGKYVQGEAKGYNGNHYEYYRTAAREINALGDSRSVEGIKSILKSSKLFPKCDMGKNYACYMTAYIMQQFYSLETGASVQGEELRKEIDAGYPKIEGHNGNKGYKVTYQGKFIIPKSLKLEGIEKCGSEAASMGVTCYEAQLDTPGVEGDKTTTYTFKVVIGTDNAANVKVPLTTSDKLKVAFKLKTKGATLDQAFVLAPTSQVQKQRMLAFDVGGDGLYVYFSPIPNKCLIDLEALDPSKCTSKDNCGINKQLFKASKCCEDIADETNAAYDYLLDTICNAKCTTSTVAPVCNYADVINTEDPGEANKGKSDIYVIKEGTYKEGTTWKYALSALPEGGGACVVNVSETEGEYFSSGGLYTKVIGENKFTTHDDSGNVRNIKEYKGNKFCQVTCKEDFELAMPAFGNFVGQRAVAAGQYFALDSSRIFMGGAMTCYTTFLDYEAYAIKQDNLSAAIVDAYNVYSSNNHGYTEMEKKITKEDYDAIYNTTTTSICPKGKTTKTYCPSHGYRDGDGNECTKGSAGCEYVCTATADEMEYECGSGGSNAVDVTYVSSVKYSAISDRYDDGTSGAGKHTYYTYTKGGTDDGSLSDDTEEFLNKDHSFNCKTSNAHGKDWHSSTDVTDSYVTCTYGDTTVKITTATEFADIKKTQDAAWDGAYELDKQALQQAAGAAAGKMNGYSNEMHDNAENFYYCQHFALYTLRIGDAAKAAEAVMDHRADQWGTEYVLGKRVTPKVVGADFNPWATYVYDENQYMQTLADENMLVRDDVTNRKFSGEDKFGEGPKDIAYKLKAGEKVTPLDNLPGATDEKNYLYNYLYSNHMEEHWYKGDGNGSQAWEPESDVAESYGELGGAEVDPKDDSIFVHRVRVMCAAAGYGSSGGTLGGGKDGPYVVSGGTQTWHEGKCFTVELQYREANYIKKSIVNSSFYVNKGKWWVGPNDIRVHGDYLQNQSDRDKEMMRTYGIYGYTSVSAFSMYNKVYGKMFSEGKGWTYFASLTNTFPISFTTARNLYQYTYQFADIGTFFGDNKLGRLMGAPESVIQVNSRTCFYEVYENLCNCCGDPIEFHTSYIEGTKSKDYTDEARKKRNECANDSCKTPDPDKIKETYYDRAGEATLNFFTTVSSLSDLSAITSTGETRKLANNWGDSFFSYGLNGGLVTKQGTKAADAIQLRGDSVYAKEPEYSYTLTPDVIRFIRDYNGKHDYVYNAEGDCKPSSRGTICDKGTYSIVPMNDCSNPGSCKWTESPGSITELTTNNVGFSHMASKFLETSEIMKAASKATKDRINNGIICDTETKDIKNYDELKACRWVDYIEKDAYSKETTDKEKIVDNYCPAGQRYDEHTDSCIKATYYRLAFK